MRSGLSFLFFIISFQVISQVKQRFIINFEFNKYELTPLSKLKLDSFLQSSSSPIQKINLYGHCDFIGDDIYNDALSLQRVDATRNYLKAHNVEDTIFETIKGFGKREPLNANSNEQERAVNRRVELVIERKEDPKPVIQIPEIKKAEDKLLSEKIKDTSLKTGSNIVLKNLNFIGGRHWLIPGSNPALEELLQVLQQNPKLEIEIQGHICCEFGPGDGYDLDTQTRDLSVNRARAIYNYLVSNNINRQRLSYKGFGHQYPLFDEDT